MSAHDTHNPDIENSGELKSRTSFKASFWFVAILVGLFIAALNFVRVMSDDQEGGHGGHATEAHGGHDATGGHEAAGHEAPASEAGHEAEAHKATGAEAEAHPTSDSAAHH